MGGLHWLTDDRMARLGPHLAFSHAWLEVSVHGCARYANQYDMTMSEALENEIYVQLCGERTERVREVAKLIQVIRNGEVLNDDLIERTQWLTELSLFILRETGRGWRPKILRNRRIRHGLAKKGLFDGDAYLVRYPDVAAAGVDPLIHYVLHGMAEGRKR